MKVLWKNIFLGLSLTLIVIWMAVIVYPEKKLHLIACDVGQGDAILATYGTTQILIDGGATNKVLDCLGRHIPFWDRKIEVVLLSHPQLDHFGGLSEVFKRFQVERFIATSLDSSSQAYEALISMVGGSGVQVINPTTGMAIRSGLLYLDIVWPTEDFQIAAGGTPRGNILGAFTSKKDSNDFSVVANLRLGEFDALLAGDIGPKIIEKIIQTGNVRDVEYIKVPHHGSKNGLTKELLDATTPEVVVISVGKNSFGHPHKEILDLLKEYGVQVKRTDEDRDVEVISDGKSWWIE
ncbi:MBL fold metallo-hydrolase [Patescibacteria group bacterium]|nr:MBL fold metallo-hydrolase [Patescibacteria group bacterium]MBU0777247.1 MBL fold metallo-hydrolase [Patescibacteria group bacterium]MBU0846198.1 MBL fold metallo-hydrolase [Patescibacteria group bacterium]MBU0922970.1 MBL fold metallo-hydrolase [Patescibacteria group bacterium]MBU1066180.1 MBL fold metallo-hydrolase [Patescibacteria group bacterium]